jgi:hypothetical protein
MNSIFWLNLHWYCLKVINSQWKSLFFILGRERRPWSVIKRFLIGPEGIVESTFPLIFILCKFVADKIWFRMSFGLIFIFHPYQEEQHPFSNDRMIVERNFFNNLIFFVISLSMNTNCVHLLKAKLIIVFSYSY